MALYLDDQTGPVLKCLLETRLKESPKDFVSKRLLDAVNADDNRKIGISDCKHVEGEYVGKKTCCVKCEGNFKVGHGISWSLKKLIKEKKK